MSRDNQKSKEENDKTRMTPVSWSKKPNMKWEITWEGSLDSCFKDQMVWKFQILQNLSSLGWRNQSLQDTGMLYVHRVTTVLVCMWCSSNQQSRFGSCIDHHHTYTIKSGQLHACTWEEEKVDKIRERCEVDRCKIHTLISWINFKIFSSYHSHKLYLSLSKCRTFTHYVESPNKEANCL